jgi:hypothetical protein
MISEALTERWMRADLARAFSGIVLVMAAAAAVGLFACSHQGRTAFGTNLGADYGEFHAVGQLLNRYPADRLYDLRLQDELLHRTLPSMPEDEHLPFVYPPFVAAAFRPLARLPLAPSFAAWLVISAAAYAGSVALVLRGSEAWSEQERSTAWLLALSFEPFALECSLGGQLSAMGCLAVASALALRREGQRFGCGLALSALLYKPTLALLILPLLLVGRRWRELAGFAAGVATLGWLSLVVAGPTACLDFVGLMASYGRGGGSGSEGFKLIKYVDSGAFFRLLGLPAALAIPAALPALGGLAVAWSRPDRGPRADLAWAAALCLTPVLNLYSPIYDVSLVAPALILAALALREQSEMAWPTPFRWLLAMVYLSALLSPALAGSIGFQPLTPALAGMGAYLLRESLKANEGG